MVCLEFPHVPISLLRVPLILPEASWNHAYVAMEIDCWNLPKKSKKTSKANKKNRTSSAAVYLANAGLKYMKIYHKYLKTSHFQPNHRGWPPHVLPLTTWSTKPSPHLLRNSPSKVRTPRRLSCHTRGSPGATGGLAGGVHLEIHKTRSKPPKKQQGKHGKNM